MKDSIQLLFLILLLTIWTDASTISLRRKQFSTDICHRMQVSRRCPSVTSTRAWHYDMRVAECRKSNEVECGATGNRFRSKEDCEKICADRCHGMQDSRLCPGAIRSWHYDVRASECRSSNEAECGAAGNRFRSKEDCETTCAGNLNISARQSNIDHGHRIYPYPDRCCPNRCPGCGQNICPGCRHNNNNICPDCGGHKCPNCDGNKCPDCGGITCPNLCHDRCPRCGCPDNQCWPCCGYNHNRDQPPEVSSSYHNFKSSNVHCPTVCSSSRLSPDLKSRYCGCRTGTIIRPPCPPRQHCDQPCRNTTNHNCKLPTEAPTEPGPLGSAVVCPIDDPNTACDMQCEFGFKKTSAGCPYCECEEIDSIILRGIQPREFSRYCNNIRASCRLRCPLGFAKDRNGCEICQCIQSEFASSADCSLKPSCTMTCEHGYQKGPDGCEICLCSHSSPD